MCHARLPSDGGGAGSISARGDMLVRTSAEHVASRSRIALSGPSSSAPPQALLPAARSRFGRKYGILNMRTLRRVVLITATCLFDVGRRVRSAAAYHLLVRRGVARAAEAIRARGRRHVLSPSGSRGAGPREDARVPGQAEAGVAVRGGQAVGPRCDDVLLHRLASHRGQHGELRRVGVVVRGVARHRSDIRSSRSAPTAWIGTRAPFSGVDSLAAAAWLRRRS